MAVILKVLTGLSEAWSWWCGSSTANEEVAYTILFVATVLSVFWLVRMLTSKKHSHRRLPPGPLALPLVGNILSLDPDLHSYFAFLAKSYGPILTLCLGKKVITVVTSPALAHEVLRVNDTTFANRDITVAGKEAMYGGNDIVWSPYGDQWRILRKICVHGMLSNHALDSVSSLRRREIRNTINYLYKQSGKPVNIGEQMFLTVLNVITSMIWGGMVKEEDRESLGGELRQAVSEIMGYLGMPNFSDFYPGLAKFDLQGIQKNVKVLAKRFDEIFERILHQRKKMVEDGNKDFLQLLVQHKDDKHSKPPFTMIHLKALLMDMVLGGTATTSNTIEFALSELMNKPVVLKKAQHELETAVGKDKIVEESQLPKLPYLYAIMKETLRLHPPVPLLIPHCPSESCTVGGYTVPKGAWVFINVRAIQRDPSIWENPLEFHPERFLDSKYDNSGNDFNYFPFGSGRRICPGTTMAERNFTLLLASLLHSFDWKLAPGEELDLSEKFGFVMKKKTPLTAIQYLDYVVQQCSSDLCSGHV